MISRNTKLWWRANKKYVWIFIFFILGLWLGGKLQMRRDAKLVVPEVKPVIVEPQEVKITPKVEPTTAPKAPQRPTKGKASYYSVEGCIGCSPNRTMANGQRLDDSRVTLAYNHAPLNTWVVITNVGTGDTIKAQITDRGGFERHGKIADLSVATKEAIGCGDVCQIIIEF